ncbi:flagellar biosynthetic protein FliO [Evansella sp. LMS18]|uniref:flagellar biosynthetic protein FliO n=1 Tax=Evansella sp. LMS18 TaxID=2924033 RepID=UPI0020D15765|nr:flagellar biosynthetic protein FliO [Evansella sp. LMS18]UTR10855.1 flagellar biosynthetic protein FliO [Evansella sp. LMS18]
MKHLSGILIVFLAFNILISTDVSAREWGDGDGTISDMINQGDPEGDNDSSVTEEEGQESTLTGDAGENGSGTMGTGENTPNLFLLSLQMFAALAFVIFLIYALLKFVNKRSRSFQQHSTIENIGGVGLGANRSVQVVKVGRKLFLVGVGETVQLIKEIEDPDEIKEITESVQPQQILDQPVSKAAEWVRNLISASNRKEKEAGDKKDFHHMLDKEMKEVRKTQDKIHSVVKGNSR